MNWDQLEGKWHQMKGAVKAKWGKLTDDDLEFIAGRQEQLIGKIHERYGIAREEARKRADEWLRAHFSHEDTPHAGARRQPSGSGDAQQHRR
jgi:uncharacterized protein YjbJ (UPF0337 family)